MAALRGKINLLKANTPIPPQWEVYQHELQRAGLVVMSLSLGLGLLVGTAFAISRLTLSQMMSVKDQLMSEIKTQEQKEVLLVSLKDRLAMAGKIFASESQWDELLATIFSLVQPPELVNLSLDEKQRLKMVIHVASVDEAVITIGKIIELTGQRKIHNPQLTQMNFNKDASVDLSLTMVPVFR